MAVVGRRPRRLLGRDLGRVRRRRPARRGARGRVDARRASGSPARRSTTPSGCSATSPATGSRSATRPSRARSASGPGTSCARRPPRSAPGLAARGVGRGDRVAAYLPNVPETIAAFLATASLGAIWSSAAPEFGRRSVIDRFAQIEPKVLLAIDGYRYGGKDFDRREAVAAIADEIGAPAVTLGYLDGTGWEEGFVGDAPARVRARPVRPPALGALLARARPACRRRSSRARAASCSSTSRRCTSTSTCGEDDRFFWFTTTGWMMWNFLVSGLLTDASIVLYDGNPGTPSLDRLWDLAEETGMTSFGTSASYLAACMKAGVEPASRPRPVPAARGRLHRLAARARGLRLGLRARRPRHVAVLHLRRHRPLHRVRRRLPGPARPRGRAPVPLARRRHPRLRRGRRAA